MKEFIKKTVDLIQAAKMKKKYEDWWEGRIVLPTDTIYPQEGEHQGLCNWEDFESDNEIIKIRNKQKEIFNEETKKIYEDLIQKFSGQYKKSKFKSLYLDREIRDISLIILESDDMELPSTQFLLPLKHYHILFFLPDLLEIRQFISEVIIQGKEINYDFIHSPTAPHRNKKLKAPLKVYAQALWDYYQWLNNFAKESSLNDPGSLEFNRKTNKFTVSAYAIMHVYLSLCGGQPVTQQNKDELARKYGSRSGVYLRNQFIKYLKNDARLGLHTENKKSAQEHLARFSSILPKLKELNDDAYQTAKKDFGPFTKKI